MKLIIKWMKDPIIGETRTLKSVVTCSAGFSNPNSTAPLLLKTFGNHVLIWCSAEYSISSPDPKRVRSSKKRKNAVFGQATLNQREMRGCTNALKVPTVTIIYDYQPHNIF